MYLDIVCTLLVVATEKPKHIVPDPSVISHVTSVFPK